MWLTILPTSPAEAADHRQLTEDAIIIPVYEGDVVPTWIAPKTLHKSGFTGAKNDVYTEWSDDETRRYIFMGLGKPIDPADPYSPEATQSAAALAAKTAKKLKIAYAAVFFMAEALSYYDICLGLLLGDFEFSKKSEKPSVHDYTFKVFYPDLPQVDFQKEVIERANHIANGIISVRNLVSDGANIVTPKWMQDTACRISGFDLGRMSCEIHGVGDLKKMGANLILAVNHGSGDHPDHQAALIHMTWRQGCSKKDPIWIIGKGVTFDSGGLNLKPGDAMRHMRVDMAGAAVCLGLMETIMGLDLEREVHCVMPVTDNMTGPMAYKVGDIYTSMSGKTVEIGNTDAEGRLILADAITYAQNHGAKKIITAATLTGAQMVALGPTAALYANPLAYNKGLVERLQRAGKVSGESVHAMPLDLRTKSLLRSKGGADICNYTGVTHAGACTAALFLNNFVNPEVAFAHLDIAGAAYSWFPLGLHHLQDDMATGFGVSLLTEFLLAE